MKFSHRAWFTVEQASSLLRIRTNTLYDLCRTGQFPCSRWGGTDDKWFIRIPCEALGLRLSPDAPGRSYNAPTDVQQLELDLDPTCLIPVRRYRNTGEVITAWDWEHRLWNMK